MLQEYRKQYGGGSGHAWHNGPYPGCHFAGLQSLRAYAAAPMKAAGRVFTIDPAQVTCKRCLGHLKNERCFTQGYEEPIGDTNLYAVVDDHKTMIMRAWFVCCRHHGAAWPLTAADKLGFDAERAWRTAQLGWWLGASIGERDKRGGDALRASVEEAEWPAEMREVACELLLAAEWLDHASDAILRADQMLEDVLKRVCSGEIASTVETPQPEAA
jgi:hypothetical protein